MQRIVEMLKCFSENSGVWDENLFEGDMILTPEQKKAALEGGDVSKAGTSRGATTNPVWPNAVLPYTIDRSLGKLSLNYLCPQSLCNVYSRSYG